MGFNTEKIIYSDDFLNSLRKLKTKHLYKYTNLPKFVFICGECIKNKDNTNRHLVEDFYNINIVKNIFCVKAESLWDKSKNSNMDLLTFENFIAELCDGIILFLESFGTACELGAFSVNVALIKKMLVFMDNKYENDDSFINNGPISKIKQISKDSIHCTNLKSMFFDTAVFNKIADFINKKRCVINTQQDQVKLNSFAIEIIELISILGPISREDLLTSYKFIKDFSSFNFVDTEGKTLSKVKIGHIVDLLIVSDIIIDVDGFLSVNPYKYSYFDFMFDIDNIQFNRIRSKLLSKIYRHRGSVAI